MRRCRPKRPNAPRHVHNGRSLQSLHTQTTKTESAKTAERSKASVQWRIYTYLRDFRNCLYRIIRREICLVCITRLCAAIAASGDEVEASVLLYMRLATHPLEEGLLLCTLSSSGAAICGRFIFLLPPATGITTFGTFGRPCGRHCHSRFGGAPITLVHPITQSYNSLDSGLRRIRCIADWR